MSAWRLQWSALVVVVAGATTNIAALPAMADEFMDQVRAEVVMFAGPQSDWRGPTSAPKPEPGKHIAYLSSNQQNDASREWGTAIAAIGAFSLVPVIVKPSGTPSTRSP